MYKAELTQVATNCPIKKYLDIVERFIFLDKEFDVELTATQAGILMRSILAVVDCGYWEEIKKMIDRQGGGESQPTQSSVAYILLCAMVAKSRGDLKEAESWFEKISSDDAGLGEYYQICRYHKGHTQQLLGNYTQAKDTYSTILSKEAKQGVTKSLGCNLADLGMAEVHLLSGDFKEAHEILGKLLQKKDHGVLWLCKIHLLQGHIHRFNHQYEQALECYKKVENLAVAAGSVAMLATAKTSLCETYCWCSPSKAIEEGQKALELNNEVAAKIEIGKTYTALSIANALIGNVTLALNDVESANRVYEHCGYAAGRLLSLQAQAIAKNALGDGGGAMDALMRLKTMVTEHGMYGFLTLPVENMLPVKAPTHGIGWLNLEATNTQLKTILCKRKFIAREEAC
jgi:tetratricopeptide (TPR) repeat protein